MALEVLVRHVCLVGALAALTAGAWRLSGLVASSSLERAVCAVVLAAAAAVLESLALGLLSLGGSTLALTIVAVVLGGVALWVVPVREAFGAWRSWGETPLALRVLAGALLGFAVAVALTELHRPAPGFDGITYHVPEVVSFVQTGRVGDVFALYYGLPVGNYPLTNEVLLAWPTGISHGLAALTLASLGFWLLLIGAAWLALRSLRIDLLPRALAVAALALGPLVIGSVPEPGTDLSSVAWLVCCGALCAGARERPALLGPALVALGLSIGTKTTGALLGLICVGLTVWVVRSRLSARPAIVSVALGGLVAAVVGLPWYVRNLLEHGSPLWPFLRTPGSDPLPLTVQLVSHTLLERFRVTLVDHLGSYLSAISGSVLLIAGGVVVPLLSGRRRQWLGAGAVAVGVLAWANAPVTGLPDFAALYGAVGSSVRYLLPVFAVGALALALPACRARSPVRPVALAVLAASIVWSLVTDFRHSFFLPFGGWLPVGVLLGGAIAAVPRARVPRRPRWAVGGSGVAGAIGVAVVLAAGSTGYLARHARVHREWDAAAARFLLTQPDFAAGRRQVAAAPDALGPLAGDRLTHPLRLIAEHASCSSLLSLSRRAWVVVRLSDPRPLAGHPGVLFPPAGTAQRCLAGARPRFDDAGYRIYGPPR